MKASGIWQERMLKKLTREDLFILGSLQAVIQYDLSRPEQTIRPCLRSIENILKKKLARKSHCRKFMFWDPI